MPHDAILNQFDGLNVWSRGGQRAPHKPLLVLYALGRWQRDGQGDIPFREVDHDLTALLKEFGQPRQSYHPEYPFWRLQNDGVWAVHAEGALKARKGNTDPPKGELLAHGARGGFSEGPGRAPLRPGPRCRDRRPAAREPLPRVIAPRHPRRRRPQPRRRRAGEEGA